MFDFNTPITKDTYLKGQWRCAPPIDPDNPTLETLKLALGTDDPASYFPVGTEFPDTYDGNSNPLIAAQYLNSTNNSSYGGAEGVILVRKYVEPIRVTFGSNSDYRDRSNNIHTVLKDYYNKSSDAIKAIMSTINVPYHTGSMTTVPSDWFLMSTYEVCGKGYNYEGVMWDYWKQKTGLTSPNDGTNVGRVVRSRDGYTYAWWLRSLVSSTALWYVESNGAIIKIDPSFSLGVLPACFVPKSQ